MISDFEHLMTEIPADFKLNSVYEIENILMLVSESEKTVEHYKNLKKSRIQSIDNRIAEYTDKIDSFRQLILNTLNIFGEKSLDFPGIGRVSKRKPTAGKWEVIDDAKVMEFVKNHKIEHVIETKEVIIKKELNKVLDEYKKQNITVPGTHLEEGQESISITFEKEEEPKSTKSKVETVRPQEVKKACLSELEV